MPAPTGVSIVIDGGNATTNDLDVVLTIAATDADEMAFSNDGVTFSPFEVFGTSKSFNLSDFNGGSAEGIRRVTVKVRDTFDNAETTAFDEILFEVPEPRIEFDVIPLQRTGKNILDVIYVGLEDSPAAAPNVTLLKAEIDLTGAFTGGEVDLLELVDDPLTDGRVGLQFSNAGNILQYVADLDKTFVTEVTSDIVKVRLQAQFGAKIGAFTESAAFSVNTTPTAVVPLKGRETIPGKEILLIAVFRNAIGEIVDTDTPPTIEKIFDPSGVDKLGGSSAVTQVTEGVYRFAFTPGIADEKGQWSYRFQGDVDGVTLNTDGFFVVVDPPSLTTPLVDNGCIVFGDLLGVDGSPHANKPVVFTPTNFSEPELQNPTAISTQSVRIDTDSAGHFEIELIRNTELVVFIPSLTYRRIGKIPNKEIVEYRSLDAVFVEAGGVRDKFGNLVS